MSITSSNNLAVNNSLTVNGNSIFGVDNTSTIICNSKPTFNSDVTINANIVQNSGTLSTTSDTNYLNGNVVIGGSKTLTTGSGLTTINGLTQANDNVYLPSGKSLYIANSLHTQYLRNHHSGTDAFLDYTGDFNLRKSGTTYTMTISNSTNKATFPYGVITNEVNASGTSSFAGLNCTSINNSGALAQTGAITCNAINSTSINNSGTITCNAINSTSINNSGTLSQTGTLSCNAINCTSINNSGILSQTGAAYFGNDINLNSGKSVYIINALSTAFLRLHHSGEGAYIDYTGGLNLRNGTGTINTFNLNNSTNQGTFNYNLNTNGITNSSTNAITNNGILYQNNLATFSSNITAPSISTAGLFYAGQQGNNFDTTAISEPKITNGIATGTADGATYTNFNLAINSWQGVGFVYSKPSGPSVCKLVIDNRSGNLTTQGDITCNSVIASTALTIPSVVTNGSIYMANANPIYLKSVSDPNHYIKYDLTNEGPQLGFYGATTMKCTENNEIIMKVSKTAVDINVNTAITGNCTISNKCTIGNGMVITGLINESKYFTLKGYTNNNSNPTTYYLYKKINGTMGNTATETFQMPTGCLSTKITYTYNSTYPGNVFQGAREYIIYGADYTGIDTVWTAGSTNYPPVITCTGYGLITIEFPKNTSLTGDIYWAFSILMI